MRAGFLFLGRIRCAILRDGLLQAVLPLVGLLALLYGLGCAPHSGDPNDPNSGPQPKYTLGLIALPPAQYSSIPLATLPAMGELPASVDLATDMPPVGNQGGQGSCTAWATGYALKTYQEDVERSWGTGTPSHQFSPAYIYNQIKQGGTGDCSMGAYLSDAFSVLTEQGCCTLATMPYDDSECDTQPSQAAQNEAEEFRIASWRRVNVQDITELRTHLGAGFPVVIGMRVYTNFFFLRGDTVYHQKEGTWEGNHAMCVVGYNHAQSTFRVINSWGTGWGHNGYFRIAYDLFRELVFEGYVADDIVSTRHTLTVNSQGQGTVTLDPPGGTYDDGTSVELTATPAGGWHFVRWEGALAGSTNPKSITMNSNKTVTAVFEQDSPDQYTLTVTKQGQGNVTLDPSGGTYDDGTSVELTATPASGWHFVRWEGALAGSTNPKSITMNSNKSVTAVFEQDSPAQYTLTVTKQGQGNVTLAPSGGTYDDGTPVELTASASSGWHFVRWQGALTGSTNPKSITMNGNKTVTAVFEEDGDQGEWRVMTSGTSKHLRAVWGSGPDDVYTVGDSMTADSTVFHYDGDSWGAMHNTSAKLNDVGGTGPSDVYTVGDSGAILHYDGNAWGTMASGTAEHLNCVWAAGVNDVFIGGLNGVMLHYNGANWSAMDSNTTDLVHKIWGTGPDDVFAVCAHGEMLHYDGAAWGVQYAYPDTLVEFPGLWGTSPSNVWVVGYDGTYGDWSAIILHYDGSGWSVMPTASIAAHHGLTSLWGTSANSIYAAGRLGTIAHYNGSAWSEMSTPTTADFKGIWGSGGTMYAVGMNGTIVKYK